MMSRIKHISVTSDVSRPGVSSFQQLRTSFTSSLSVLSITGGGGVRFGSVRFRFRFRCPGSVRFRRAVSGFGSVPTARGPGLVRFPPRGVRVRFGSPIRDSESVRCRVRFGMYNRTRGLPGNLLSQRLEMFQKYFGQTPARGSGISRTRVRTVAIASYRSRPAYALLRRRGGRRCECKFKYAQWAKS